MFVNHFLLTIFVNHFLLNIHDGLVLGWVVVSPPFSEVESSSERGHDQEPPNKDPEPLLDVLRRTLIFYTLTHSRSYS